MDEDWGLPPFWETPKCVEQFNNSIQFIVGDDLCFGFLPSIDVKTQKERSLWHTKAWPIPRCCCPPRKARSLIQHVPSSTPRGFHFRIKLLNSKVGPPSHKFTTSIATSSWSFLHHLAISTGGHQDSWGPRCLLRCIEVHWLVVHIVETSRHRISWGLWICGQVFSCAWHCVIEVPKKWRSMDAV